MMRRDWPATSLTAVLECAAPLLVTAHGGHDIASKVQPTISDIRAAQPLTHGSYFAHPGYHGWVLAHLTLMLIAWVIVLPVALVLSIARSRLRLLAQATFHIANSLGLLTGVVYDHATPDLYQGNVHSTVGWIVTSLTVLWTFLSLWSSICGRETRGRGEDEVESLEPLMTAASRSKPYEYEGDESPRWSDDSRQGTERNSSSLPNSRQHSSDSVTWKQESAPPTELAIGHESQQGKGAVSHRTAAGLPMLRGLHTLIPPRLSLRWLSRTPLMIAVVLEHTLLLGGFAAIASGLVIFAGIFRDEQIFSGLAHIIKGGVFFFHGLFTLGRWFGAFREWGWAWNLRPARSRAPSAEFLKSFLLCLYGASNVFLEHLNTKNGVWTASDMEHVSITLLFFGGGLLGMIVETVDLSNNAAEKPNTAQRIYGAHEDYRTTHIKPVPERRGVSHNPMPAVVLLILGMLMSGHEQKSMTSTMMHGKFGGLMFATALARGVTYTTLYIKPPQSSTPTRPPSEIVAAFCLTAGGFMLIASVHDIVEGIEASGLDAISVFAGVIGFTGVVLAWAIIVFAFRRLAGAEGRKDP